MSIPSAFDMFIKSRKLSFGFILLIILIIATRTIVYGRDENNIRDGSGLGQLPYCGDENSRTISRRLLYVTTLDGKITALDLSQNGKVYWEIPTGPGPLISSSIHRLELTNNGQLVRMIPSLNGGIYKFDGESIDPISITADNLLSSSFKFSDDLVISGGKETRSYGVSVRTGQILYECSMNGCLNNTEFATETSEMNEDHDQLLDDVVVIRRQTQTVRAVEPRTGNERWNFSVGQHEIEVLKSPECHDRPLSKSDVFLLNLSIKVIVPDGIICVFNKNSPNTLLWKHQFDHPIVSAWKTGSNDELTFVDLFESAQWLWNLNNDQISAHKNLIAPSIYLGMFQKQLYIQESQKMHQILIKKSNRFDYHLIESTNINLPTIPWKPVRACNTLLIENQNINTENETDDINIAGDDDGEDKVAVTALSVLYASEYVNGNGFYLFTAKDLNKTTNGLCDSNETKYYATNESNEENYIFQFNEDETPVKIIIISMWYWWKEILMISLTTGLLLNVFFSPKIHREREVVVIERHIAVPTALEATEESMSSLSRNTQRSYSESNSNTSENFSSRFDSDFNFVQCLGKGGFGVVFEAKNKLDDCNYAVKRIQLPNKREKKDRVMREVKTLANCEHHNIVRYFQAWVEMPPPGWQEEKDAKWFNHDASNTSIEIETPDGTTLPSFLKHSNVNDSIDKTNNINPKPWISKMAKNKYTKCIKNEENYELSQKNDDSFIQFKAENIDELIHQDDRKSLSHNTQTSAKLKNRRMPANQLDSSSFQIEFEQSDDYNDEESSEHSSSDNTEQIQRNITQNCKNLHESVSYSKSYNPSVKSSGHKRPLSLDLLSNLSNLKSILPLNNSQTNLLLESVSTYSQKITQNKVYLYIQMQLCKKESLRDWLREHRIEMRQPHTQSIFQQIVDAVDYVHQKGLIHRDLKPSNIFFSLDGQIRIGDFGLVTDMPEIPNCNDFGDTQYNGITLQKSSINRHTQQVGTHLYMSPEQLQGKSYDFHVDIYSLGLIFFELLVYFGTEMERIVTLKGLRVGNFPSDFQNKFPEEHDLLKLMLSNEAVNRPATHDIKEKLMNMISWMNNNFQNIGTTKVRRLSEISSSSY